MNTYQFIPYPDKKLTKIQQIVRAIVQDIEMGILEKDFRLPSIDEFSKQHIVARDTVEKAYKILKKNAYIKSVPGKGNYILGKKDQKLKILLIFNKLSSYKKIIYDSFLETLGNQAKVDLQIHHYNPRLLEEIIDQVKESYHYYVVMPHFFHQADKEEYLKVIRKIPVHQLIVLDKAIPQLEGNYASVYQDFKEDIYTTLSQAAHIMDKYKALTIVFPNYSNHPTEILDGLKQFSKEHKKAFCVISTLDNEVLKTGTAYITVAEGDLAQLIKKVRKSEYQLGTDIGIISFNETVFKELLDITVITTDFEEMGRSAAKLILNRQYHQIKNPFKMIKRKSL